MLNKDDSLYQNINLSPDGILTMEFKRYLSVFNNKTDIPLNVCNNNLNGVYLSVDYGYFQNDADKSKAFYATKSIDLGRYCFVSCLGLTLATSTRTIIPIVSTNEIIKVTDIRVTRTNGLITKNNNSKLNRE
jgi:hypothetical protein